jgi:hypothetical protein
VPLSLLLLVLLFVFVLILLLLLVLLIFLLFLIVFLLSELTLFPNFFLLLLIEEKFDLFLSLVFSLFFGSFSLKIFNINKHTSLTSLTLSVFKARKKLIICSF